MTKSISNEPKDKKLAFVPTLEFYERTYGRNCEGNDQKALWVFRNFEAQEKVRRLQNELYWLKEEMVLESVCKRILGAKRIQRYGSYKRWAELMLLWLSRK